MAQPAVPKSRYLIDRKIYLSKHPICMLLPSYRQFVRARFEILGMRDAMLRVFYPLDFHTILLNDMSNLIFFSV